MANTCYQHSYSQNCCRNFITFWELFILPLGHQSVYFRSGGRAKALLWRSIPVKRQHNPNINIPEGRIRELGGDRRGMFPQRNTDDYRQKIKTQFNRIWTFQEDFMSRDFISVTSVSWKIDYENEWWSKKAAWLGILCSRFPQNTSLQFLLEGVSTASGL